MMNPAAARHDGLAFQPSTPIPIHSDAMFLELSATGPDPVR